MTSHHPKPIYDVLSKTIPYLFPPSIRDGLLDGTSSLLSWQPGHTPFSTGPTVLLAGISYLALIFSGRELMRKYKLGPWRLHQPFVLHNALLSLASALLLACMLEEILPLWKEFGFYYAICDRAAWTPRMETLYIFNYMFKFWELLDTVFLVLKGKKLAFLHVYHHSATALLCFSQLLGKTSVSWVVICLNLAVHVVMYFYYMLAAMRIPCPWKRAVTVMQILQFVIDLGIVYFAAFNYFVNAYSIPFPSMGACAAEKDHAVWSGCLILSSYLLLFIAFYKKTYNSKKRAGESHNNFVRNAQAAASEAAKRDMITGEKDVSSALTTQTTGKGRVSTPALEKGAIAA